MKLRLFWILWGIDALICVITVVFFFIGILDGSVSSFNMGIWMAMLSVLAVIIGGSLWLKRLGHPVMGSVLLGVFAIPGLISGLFLFLFIVTDTSWN